MTTLPENWGGNSQHATTQVVDFARAAVATAAPDAPDLQLPKSDLMSEDADIIALKTALLAARDDHVRDVRAHIAAVTGLQSQLARWTKSEHDFSRLLTTHDQLTRQLALTRRNFELADRTSRIMNQLDELAARTLPIKVSGGRLSAPRRIALALNRLRRGERTKMPFFTIKRLRHELRKSPLFDVHHYRKIAGLRGSANALSHYLRHGLAAGLSPHPLFDPGHYRRQWPNLERWHVDPFVHYVFFPFELDPHPLFSTEYYLCQYPELQALGISPLQHYVEHGFRERTSPHPSFSGSAYLDRYPDVAAAGVNPLLHYIMFGRAEGRRIDPAY